MDSDGSMTKKSATSRYRSKSPGSDVSMDGHKYKAKLKSQEEDDKIFGTNPNKVSGSMATIIRSLKKSTDIVEKEINDLKNSLDIQNRIIKKSVKDLTQQYLESVKNASNNRSD